MTPTLRKNCNTCKHLIREHVWSECHYRTGTYTIRSVRDENGCNTAVSICKAYVPKNAIARKGSK